MPKAENVTAAKPGVSGAVFVAELGTELPTDAVTELSSDFTCLGYISEDGVTNTNSVTAETVEAWGGDVVLVVNQGRSDTLKFKLLEALNVDVLKYVFGDDNVSGSLDEGIVVNVNSDDLDDKAMVVDMIMRNGALKRICVPDAAITSMSEVSYTDSGATGYEVTVTALPDDAGNKHYEYIQSATTTTTE